MWEGPDADDAYWELMPPESSGEPSEADSFVQELLQVRKGIKLEGFGGDDDHSLAGRFYATEDALRIALKHLSLSPRTRYIAAHALSEKATPL